MQSILSEHDYFFLQACFQEGCPGAGALLHPYSPHVTESVLYHYLLPETLCGEILLHEKV